MAIFSIAIDGPAGAGKSTIAKAAAEYFGIVYVDTGALYRTIALAVHRAGLSCEDRQAVIDHLPKLAISLCYHNGEQQVLLSGQAVGDAIRKPEISRMASQVSAIPEVRGFLLDTQRSMAKRQSVIMDGRDIGTVILPDATLKIFLTASAVARATRRHEETKLRGEKLSFEQVLAEIEQRDEQDRTRAEAPLRQAEDAVLLDTSEMTLEQSIKAVIELIAEKTEVRVDGKA